jgi:hypothetical protein
MNNHIDSWAEPALTISTISCLTSVDDWQPPFRWCTSAKATQQYESHPADTPLSSTNTGNLSML